MSINTLTRALAGIATVLLYAAAPGAQGADTYPTKPVRIVVPTAPGGGLDMLARLMAQNLSKSLGQTFVIDNRPGAGATIGTALVAKSAPDGYTLLMVPSSISISASLYKNLPYDSMADLAAVTLVASTPSVFILHPSVPVSSVRDLLKLAKARPGQLVYASGGSGTHSHLGMEMLKTLAAVDLVHVPYKGTGPALTDVLSGHVSLMIIGLPPAFPQIKAGKLRVIAVTDSTRSSLLPAVPTIAESGFPGYAVENWFGLFAPAATPSAIIAKLNAEVARAFRTAQVRDNLVALGYEPVASTPAALAAQLKSEIPKWAQLIQKLGVAAN